MPPDLDAEQIATVHQLYCHLTGQSLRRGFDRERQWYEWLRAGFTPEDLRRVIAYLQREIREGRRNVGALKLSNLLQPDRFEEDLNIRCVRLKPIPRAVPNAPSLSAEERERRRLRALQCLRQIKETLRHPCPLSPGTAGNYQPTRKPRTFQHDSV